MRKNEGLAVISYECCSYDPNVLLKSFLTIAFHFFLPVGARLVTKCNQGVGFIYFWITVINLETQSCLLFNLTYIIFFEKLLFNLPVQLLFWTNLFVCAT